MIIFDRYDFKENGDLFNLKGHQLKRKKKKGGSEFYILSINGKRKELAIRKALKTYYGIITSKAKKIRKKNHEYIEKYIYKQCKTYILQIKKFKVYDKFKTLDEAKAYKEKYIEEYNERLERNSFEK